MPKPNRQPLYAKIAIARKQLVDMDEDAYRALLENKFGVRSASKLSFVQLSALVQLLAEMGAVYTQPGQRMSNTKVTSKARPDWIEVKAGDPLILLVDRLAHGTLCYNNLLAGVVGA